MRQSEGLRLLISIYVDHSHDLWRESAVLEWCEEVTAATMSTFHVYEDEMLAWEKLYALVSLFLFSKVPSALIVHFFAFFLKEWIALNVLIPFFQYVLRTAATNILFDEFLFESAHCYRCFIVPPEDWAAAKDS